MPITIRKKIVLICSRCSYEWTPKKEILTEQQVNEIVRCPNCSTPYWNKERRNKKK